VCVCVSREKNKKSSRIHINDRRHPPLSCPSYASLIPPARILPYFSCLPVMSTKLIIRFVGIFGCTVFLLVLIGRLPEFWHQLVGY
jgi:hypothetical protein